MNEDLSFNPFPRVQKDKREVLGIYMTSAGILCWFYVLATQRIWWIPSTYPLGIYQVIHPLFWAGIVLLVTGILVRIDSESRRYFFFQIFILQLMIWVTPAILQPNARVTDTWAHFSITRAVMEGMTEVARGGVYLNWPGGFVFTGTIYGWSGLDAPTFLRWFPVLSTSLFVLGIIVFMNRLVGDNIISRGGILIFLPLNIWLQFHHSPHAFALMLFPVALIGIFLVKEAKWRLIAVFLTVIITIAHPTTSIFLGSIVVSVFIMEIITSDKQGKKKILPLGFLSLAMIILTLAMLIRSDILKFVLVGDLFWGLPDVVRTLAVQRFSNPISAVRGFVLVFMSMMSLAGMMVLRHDRRLFCLSSGWIIGVTGVFVLSLTIPGAHFHQRAFVYLYFIVSFLVMVAILYLSGGRLFLSEESSSSKPRTMSNYVRLAFVVLILICLVNLSTIYNGENEAVISEGCLRSAEFIIEHTEDEIVFGERVTKPLRSFDPNRKTGVLFQREGFPDQCVFVFDSYAFDSEITGPRTTQAYSRVHESYNTALVYSGGGFDIYIRGR